ncbi:hypothetical protein QP940_09670 [Corynebacterium pseudodiphtheriticum]|nr:hypothetical protein [Corynebacterium pseudodiphtheriticum]MDK8614906.1 hypothetical protein [Corynebacterium pseudodiphtheriticum]MDK8738959.1 hypothetical protein [Corynebacterium pseudodiphtheriticum]MDK8745500.1 hypothetical protein [Corynebacterium pseudodiphtheriticum]
MCNDGASADECLDVAGQFPHGWGICDVGFSNAVYRDVDWLEVLVSRVWFDGEL